MTAEHAHGIDTGGEDPRTHGLNHAPLPDGTWLAPGFCADCDEERATLACALVTHADPEEYARIYNEGYDAAYAQELADNPSAADDWLEAHDATTRQAAADAVLAEARRLCCGNNPSAHHAASAKHSERMAFAGDLARAVRGT